MLSSVGTRHEASLPHGAGLGVYYNALDAGGQVWELGRGECSKNGLNFGPTEKALLQLFILNGIHHLVNDFSSDLVMNLSQGGVKADLRQLRMDLPEKGLLLILVSLEEGLLPELFRGRIFPSGSGDQTRSV